MLTQIARLIIHKNNQKYATARKSGDSLGYPHSKTQLTTADVEAHIKGTKTIGVMLCQEGTGLVKATVIDIDVPRDAKDLTTAYELAQRLQQTAEQLGITTYIEFSGNRGFHLWLFTELLPGNAAVDALRTIARKAVTSFPSKFPSKFPEEIFPNSYPTESKCIKLPGGIHLKSGKRCGFIRELQFDDDGYPVLPEQEELMSTFVVNPKVSLLALLSSSHHSSSVNSSSSSTYNSLSSSYKPLDSSANFSSSSTHNSLSSSYNPLESSLRHKDATVSRFSPEEVKTLLKANFVGGNHPGCVEFLLTQGAPLDLDYHHTNLTLVRYCLTRGFSLEEGMELAKLLAKATPDSHHTSKTTVEAKVLNFRSSYSSASRKPDDYSWKCSYALSGISTRNPDALAKRGCKGPDCPLWCYAPPPAASSNPVLNPKILMNRALFTALLTLLAQDKEIRKSTLLLELEVMDLGRYTLPKTVRDSRQSITGHSLAVTPSDNTASVDGILYDNQELVDGILSGKTASVDDILYDNQELVDGILYDNQELVNSLNSGKGEPIRVTRKLMEDELLAYFLQKPEVIELFDYNLFDLAPEAFISLVEDADEHLDYILQITVPKDATAVEYFLRLHDLHTRELLATGIEQHLTNIQRVDIPLETTVEEINNTVTETIKKAANEIVTLEHLTEEYVRDLFTQEFQPIATPSPWLNNLLVGGLHRGKLYILGAPPGSGKTTWCAWLGDFVASNNVPVLIVSYEMSAQQLFIYSLSRMGGINSQWIEGRQWLDGNTEAVKNHKILILNTTIEYTNKVAKNVAIIEGEASHNPAKLKALILKFKRMKGLDKNAPVLVVVDYLQLMFTGDDKLDSSVNETAKVSRLATELKRLARATQSAVIAISDITKEAYSRSEAKGELDLAALRDSFKIAHAADTIFVIQSHTVPGKGENEPPKDQLHLAIARNSDKTVAIDECRRRYPLNPITKDCYARMTLLKNRGGLLGEPLFIYHKALHSFTPINLDLKGEDDDLEI